MRPFDRSEIENDPWVMLKREIHDMIEDRPFSERLRQELPHLVAKWQNLRYELDHLKRHSSLNQVAEQAAHDIRAPLTAFSLLEPEFQVLGKEKRDLLKCAVSRIQGIANDLIHRLHHSPQVVELAPLIREIATEKRLLIGNERQLEVIFTVQPSDESLCASVEPHQFRRVISNLLNNAIEAVDDAGRIEIELRRDGPHTLIVVRDNGCGIPAEILDNVTDRGFSNGKDEGTGLGLYHAQACAQSWGGRLLIESIWHVGTCIALQLPAKPD